MSRLKTNDEFIHECRLIHGDRYDYSKVMYVGRKKNVEIICKVHGVYSQSAYNHSIGHGCRKCASRAPKKITYEYFIKKAQEVHGDKYDYSLISDLTGVSHVEIICPIHGKFKQKKYSHLHGFECNKCGNDKIANKKNTTFNEFVKKSRLIHGEKYFYSESGYKNAKSNVNITCSIHGDFSQQGSSHLAGRGCPTCANMARWESREDRQTTDGIINIFREIHGNYFDYSKVEYTKYDSLLIISCPIHGEFQQSPNNHRAGKGCPNCKNIMIGNALRKNLDEVISDFQIKHGDLYDYKHVRDEYSNADTPVTIICKKHGAFKQAPYNHLQGKGCPRCKESHGERLIASFLESHAIEFIPQWRDHDCIDKRQLSFDFYLPELAIIIEFDGELHFNPQACWWSTNKEKNIKNFENIQYRDNLKNIWANKNNLQMVRIKYDEEPIKILKKYTGIK